MEIQDELVKQQFLQRENGVSHPTYDAELAYYDIVKNGDLDTLDKKEDWDDIVMPGRGVLSRNPLRNFKYHLIVTVAMITRFCIEGGLSEQEAYMLSDIYINRIDEAADENTLKKLQKEISYDFANRMRRQKAKQNHTVHCTKALDYIYNHLHENISVQDVADAIGLNVTYASKLFLKETGHTICDFVRLQKIKAAERMLVYSGYSCSEIAQYLAFASNSHFSRTFKKYTGMTPLQFRNQNYRTHFKK